MFGTRPNPTRRFNLRFVLVLALASGGGRELAATAGYFHADGRRIVADATGESWVFRGVNLTGLEFGAFGNHPYPGVEGTNYFVPRVEDLDGIQAAGFNVVRLPFEWARLVAGWKSGDALPGGLNASYLALLDNVVAMAAQRGLWVILDMHDFLKYWSGPSTQVCVSASTGHQQMLAETWKLLARHYAGEPAILGYDLMNEPVRQETGEPCGSCDWHAIAQSLVDAIRSEDGDHLVFVEGPNYSLASDWPVENGDAAALLDDSVEPDRLVYSPHAYFDFNNDSHYDQAGEEIGPLGEWQHYVRDRLLPAVYWSFDHDVPLLIGEAGVPCGQAWAAVLDHALDGFFEPLHLSLIAWQYIDPERCSLDECPLNLLACPSGDQVATLMAYPGGVYTGPDGSVSTLPFSALYGDQRTNPWNVGAGFFDDAANPGISVDFCATDVVFEGSCSIRVDFLASNFAAVKLVHQFGLDSRDYSILRFRIYLTGAGLQDFKIFTTAPVSDCALGADPVYPPTYDLQPQLNHYLGAPLPDQWLQVDVPLHDGSLFGPIVDPAQPNLNGIAFQNVGIVQADFYLDDVRLIAAGIFTDGFESGDTSAWSATVP